MFKNITFTLVFLSACATPLAPKSQNDQIDEAIKVRENYFRQCYEHELSSGAKVDSGRVVLAWLLQTNGRAIGTTVAESTLKNKKVEDCLIEGIN